MGNLVEWFGQTHLVVALLALTIGPGFLAMRAARFSTAISVALGPALTFVTVGFSGIAFDLLGIPWNILSFIGSTVLAIMFWYMIGRLGQPGVVRGFCFNEGNLPTGTMRWLAISFGLALAFVVVPILLISDPSAPSTQADPVFHYNGVNAVVQTSNASMITAMAPQYGIQAVNSQYPTVWHGLLGLLGDGSIMEASHVLAYVVIPMISMISLAFFMRATLPSHPLAWVFAAPVSVALPYFPNFLTISRGFWPNSLALAVVPAVVGLLVLVVRSVKTASLGELLLTLFVALTALGGVGFAHPGAVFAVLWPAVPVVAIGGGIAVTWTIRERTMTRRRALAISGLVAFLVVGIVLTMHPRVNVFLNRDHPRSWNTRERLETLGSTLTGVNPALIGVGAVLGVAVLALILVALRTTWRVREGRWLVIAWIAQLLVVFGSYVDGNIFSAVAGIWYHDPKRVMAILSLFTTAILALLAERVAVQLNGQRERRILATGLVAVSMTIGVGLRVGSVYPDARPAIGPDQMIDSRDEIALLEELDEIVPRGSVIIGDATTGIGYAPSYSRVNVVFPQVNTRAADKTGGYLRENFHDIHTDPYVCQILTHYGIGYYYEDDPLVYQKRDRSETWPGLYDVDTSRGFTKIAESDGGTLWRIDACGTMGEPDWWDLDARFEALPRADQ